MAFWKKVVLVVLACVASYVWYALFTLHPNVLTVSILDVGQGDAIFIETPSGNQMLIDGGSGRKVLGELSSVMPAHDRSIDLVLATHTDMDHLGGLNEVLKSYRVGTAIDNSFVAQTDIYKNWKDSLSKNHVPEKTVRAGDRIILDQEVVFDVLGPTEEDFIPPPAGGAQTANEVMVVGRLRYGKNTFLFMGDIERPDEIRLAQSGVDLASDVLKVAHHGSKYASTDLFLSKIHPMVAVVSVGVRNRYGHPTSEALERLKKTGAEILRTDERGRITFVSDGLHITKLVR